MVYVIFVRAFDTIIIHSLTYLICTQSFINVGLTLPETIDPVAGTELATV